MKKIYQKKSFLFIVIVLGAIFFSSCRTPKNVVYFSDLDSTKISKVNISEFKEPVIQTDDILSITIQTTDFATSSTLSQGPVLAGASSSGNSSISGFLVDKMGNVEIPMLGVLKLAGLTTTEAKDVIKAKAARYYKEPTVQVRFANYKITVLGEVAKPASYSVPNEKVTVLDAISMAGDLTIYGKRNNVLLMRDDGDKKVMVRLDLSSSSLISSPYFYLRQNDVLYVEPTRAKIASNNTDRNRMITMGISIIALMVTIITRL